MARKFADEEHLRRYIRQSARSLKGQVDIALGYLDDGDLAQASDFFDSAEGISAELSRVCLDWPENRAKDNDLLARLDASFTRDPDR